MLIINKTDVIQRTTVQGVKQDIKPGEIVEMKKEEAQYVVKNYGNIFGVMEVKEDIKEEVKEKKVKSKK